MKKNTGAIIITLILTQSMSFGAANYGYETSQNNMPQSNIQYPVPTNSYNTQGYKAEYGQPYCGRVVMVPAKTAIEAKVMTGISSETAQIGDGISLYLPSDFYYGKDLIAGAGSCINGTVIKVKKGGFGSKNGMIQIRFTNLVTPYGQIIPITASIETQDGTGILKAGTVKDSSVEYAKDLGIGAAAGAALGTAMGALSGGSVGKGAIYGTAIGGGGGLVKAIADKGDNVEIPQNAIIKIIFDQPVTVSSNNP